MHSFLSKKIFLFDFNTNPFKPNFLQSLSVCIPTVGKSILRSCLFLEILLKLNLNFL